MEGLGAVPWGSITPMGLLLLLVWAVVWAIVSGRLVPRSTHEEVVKDRDYWRADSLERSRQMSQLLPSVDAATRMIEAMVRANPPDGDS